MTSRPRITDVRFHAASPDLQATGLIGWAAFSVDGSLRVEQVAVRRTATGRLALSFPARRDGKGRQRFYTRPLDDETRRLIEREVFGALGLVGRDYAS